MRVILAGASGIIGRYLLPQLLAAGHEVFGVTRRGGTLASTGATEVVADLTQRSRLLRAIDGIAADAVVHLAVPQRRPPFHARELLAANRVRTEGTSALVAAVRQSRASRFVVASSVIGYGYADHGSGFISEDSTFGRLPGDRGDAEQAALLSIEQQCRSIGGISLRFGLLYATGTDSPVSRNASGLLPWLHPRDAAAATMLALTRGTPGASYNIADSTPATWREMQTAQVVGARRPVGPPDWILKLTEPSVFPLMTRTNLRVSTARARRDLRWEPQYPSYREGLQAG